MGGSNFDIVGGNSPGERNGVCYGPGLGTVGDEVRQVLGHIVQSL